MAEKTIDTLEADINQLLSDTLNGKSYVFHPELLSQFAINTGNHLQDTLMARKKDKRPEKTLYMSEIGKPLRQLWYSYHKPELAEPLQPHTLFKFTYGDVLEEMVLTLAEAAGHKVEQRQEPTSIYWLSRYGNKWELRGKQDAVIDGVLVDVKSTSPFGMKKFAEGLTDDNDSFGYRMQLSGYNYDTGGSRRQGFLAVDKQNGHIKYFDSPYVPVDTKLPHVIEALENEHTPPDRCYDPVPEGASGNMKLGTECSYCAFKKDCWADANNGAGLRAFKYSTGPVFLVKVKKEPRVPEIPLHDLKEAA